VANFLPRSIILTMVVSFAISFGVLYWQRKTQEQSVARVEAVPADAVHGPNLAAHGPKLAAHGSAELPARPPIPEHGGLTAQSVARVDPPEEAAQSGEEAPAEALPVAFHIRNRRDLHVIDGDIRNITSKPMSITLRSVNPSTQATSEMHFELAPGERKTYSTDGGLSMQTDDQLIVQSPPYQDRVVRVP
jgi:hypothetical protein